MFNASAKNYYVSSKGSDNNSGASSSQPWQTITKLSSAHFYPGDSILFNGGDTLSGIIYVTAQDSGTDAYPVVFSSYGNSRATINGGTGAAFYGYNAGGFTIQNINFIGSGAGSNTNSGIVFYTDTSNGHKFNHISINNSDISGFGQCGIIIGSYHSSYPGYQGIRITNVNVSSVGQKGIFLYDFAGQSSSLYGHKNLYIGHCTVMYSGIEGILVSGVDSGLVEYCHVGYTGYNTNKGDAGIWAYSANNITFQYCISDHATTTGSDGEGFDLDGGTQNCVVQYCYAYQNYACGFMHCDYPDSRQNYNNIIRYCISENDGRKPVDDESSFLFISWGTGIDHCYMYNNTAFISDNGTHPVSAFRGYILTGSAPNPYINNCMAVNNILYIRGLNQNSLVSMYSPNGALGNSNIFFAGNCYFSTNSQNWVNNNNTYSSLRNWQDSTKEETLNGPRTGYLLNPGLVNPGGGGALTNPDSLKYISAYKLKPNDPIIGRGLDIDTLFNLKSPLYDFYGNTLNPFEVYSIGADDPQPDKHPLAGFHVTNTCLGDSTLFIDSSSGAISRYWNFGDTALGISDTSTLVSPTHKYNQSGTYIIMQVVRSLYGYNDTLKKILQIYPKAVAKFYAANACALSPVHFIDSSLNTASYAWNFGDDSISNIQSPNHIYKKPGMYLVSLKIISSGGCMDSASQNLEIYGLPTAKFNSYGKCVEDSIVFVDASVSAVAWDWNFGDGDTGNMQNPKHLFQNPGSDTTLLTVYSSNGCKDTFSKVISIFPKPKASFTFSNVCFQNPTIFHDTSNVNPVSYSWNFGDGSPSDTINNPKHLYEPQGQYHVLLTAISNEGCMDTFSQNVEVYPLPDAKFTSSITGLTLQVKAIDTVETYYSWNFGDMDSLTGVYDVSHNYTKGGMYDVKLTVKNTYGCLSIKSAPEYVLDSGSGIKMSQTAGNNFINVYPNPFTDKTSITYSIDQQGIVIITINNEEGKQIAALSNSYQNAGNHSIEIDIENLNLKPGTYLIKIQSEQQIATIKLIKL